MRSRPASAMRSFHAVQLSRRPPSERYDARPDVRRPSPMCSTSSLGISSRKRDGGLYCVDPNSVRLQAWLRYSFSRARVMPT